MFPADGWCMNTGHCGRNSDRRTLFIDVFFPFFLNSSQISLSYSIVNHFFGNFKELAMYEELVCPIFCNIRSFNLLLCYTLRKSVSDFVISTN